MSESFEVRYEHPEDGFTPAPNPLVCDGRISTNAKAVYLAIASFAWGSKDSCVPGQATLQQFTGCSESTVRRATRELEKFGWVRVERRGFAQTNIYWLTRPAVTRDRIDQSPVTGRNQSPVTAEENKKEEEKTTVGGRSAPSALREWEEFLSHYHAITGKTRVRGSKADRGAFNARRKDGYSLEDLKLAIDGCVAHVRSDKFWTPETILRDRNVPKYLAVAQAAKPKSGTAPTLNTQDWLEQHGPRR